jgi:hypothetical protein
LNTYYRDDPIILSIFREIGSKRSSGTVTELKIGRIPISIDKYCTIVDHDGRGRKGEITYNENFFDYYLKLEAENEELKKKVMQLETHIACSPGGEEYLAAQREFNGFANQQ